MPQANSNTNNSQFFPSNQQVGNNLQPTQTSNDNFSFTTNFVTDPNDPNYYTDFLNVQIPQVQFLDKNGLDLTKFENNPILRAEPELRKYENLLIDLQDGTFFGKRQTSDEEMSKLWDQRYYGDDTSSASKSNVNTNSNASVVNSNIANTQNDAISQVNQVNSNSSQVPNLSNFLSNYQNIPQNQINNVGNTNQQSYDHNQSVQNPFQNINFQSSNPQNFSNQNFVNFVPNQVNQQVQPNNLNNYNLNNSQFSNSQFTQTPQQIVNTQNNFVNQVQEEDNFNDLDGINDNDDSIPQVNSSTSTNLLNQSLNSQLNPQVNNTQTPTSAKIESRAGSSIQNSEVSNQSETKSEEEKQVESQVEKIKEQLKQEAAKEKQVKPQVANQTSKSSEEAVPKDLSKTIESVLGSIKLYGYSAPSSAINKIARSKEPKSLYRNFDTYSARSWLFALLGKLALKQKEEQGKKK